MENANKVLPEVSIEIGGKTFKIKASFKVLIAVQRATGKNPFKGEFMTDISPIEMAIFLHCAISTVDPSITLDWVEENMGGKHMKTIAEVVNALYENSMPDAEKDEAGESEEKKPE